MKRIYRSSRDKKLFGVCGGIGEAAGIDPTILRILLVIVTVFSGGAPIPIYIIAALVMPKEPMFPPPHYGAGNEYGGYHSAYNAGYGGTPNWNASPPPPPPPRPSQGYYPPHGQGTNRGSNIDDLMEDIEKKAMKKEIEELKEKLDQLEKRNKGDDTNGSI